MDLTDVYRTFHPTASNYTFISSIHGTFSRTDQILSHKRSLNIFNKTEIIASVFSDHNNVMKLEINNRMENSQICGN